MALDSAGKRQAAFSDAAGMLIPDTTIDATDRAWLVGQYFTAASSSASSANFDECGYYTGAREWDARLYTSAGKRKRFRTVG